MVQVGTSYKENAVAGTFSYWILYSTFLTLSNIAYMSECIWNNIITATAVFRARPGGSLPSAPGPAGHRGRHGPEQERRHGEGRVRGGGGAQAGVPGPAAAALPPPLPLPDVPLRLGWMFCSFSSKRFSESHINNVYTHTQAPCTRRPHPWRPPALHSTVPPSQPSASWASPAPASGFVTRCFRIITSGSLHSKLTRAIRN